MHLLGTAQIEPQSESSMLVWQQQLKADLYSSIRTAVKSVLGDCSSADCRNIQALDAPFRFSGALIHFSNLSSALFKSSLLDNKELFPNTNRHKHSQHTYTHTHAQGRLHLVFSASRRVAREKRFNTRRLRNSRHKAPTKTLFQCIFHFCKAF